MQYSLDSLRAIDSAIRQGRFREADAAARTLFGEARPSGAALAQLLFLRGKASRNLGSFAEAERFYGEAAEAFEALGDDESVADAKSGMSLARWQLGDFPRATSLSLDALRIYERIGDELGVANANNTTGLIAWKRDEYAEAIRRFEAALARYESLSHAQGLAATVNNLGGVYQDMGDLGQSAHYFAEAVRLYERAGDSAGVATASGNLAWTLARSGSPAEAAPYAARAIDGFEEAGDLSGFYRALMQRAQVKRSGGRLRGAAYDLYRAAHGAGLLGMDELEAITIRDLVEVLYELGLHSRVGPWYERILRLEARTLSAEKEKEIIRLGVDMELESRRREEARLVAALEERDRLLAMLFHDSRAAMSRLCGELAALGFELPSLELAAARERLLSIEERAAQAQAQLETALAWARSRDGSLEPSVEDVPLREAVETALAGLRHPLAIRGMRAELACAGPGPTVRADRRLLGMIIVNVLSNALEHGAAGRPILVAISSDGGGTAALTVRNRIAPTGEAGLGEARASVHGFGLALCADLGARMGGGFVFDASGDEAEARLSLPSTGGPPST